MARGLKILIFILLYLLFSSRSCDDDSDMIKHQETRTDQAKESILKVFEADNLSDAAIEAAEINAINKVKDLADYVNIYTDNSLDSIFREKAGVMIRGLFISEDAGLSFNNLRSKNKKMKDVSLIEFLDDGFGDDVTRARLSFDSVRVITPLQKKGEDLYSGQLSCRQSFIQYYQSDSIVSGPKPVVVVFHSSRQIKIIGTDTLKIWEVRLGDMEE